MEQMRRGDKLTYNGHPVKIQRKPGCIFRVETEETIAEANDLESILWLALHKYDA
jgi:hypothetical protein